MGEAEVTVGGKASSLSSSSVFAVSTSLANLRIDSSALERETTTTTTVTTSSCKHIISLPDFLSQEESRASLLVLLNKLLLSNSPNRIALLISQTLNSQQPLQFQLHADVTQDELFVLLNSSSTLLGVSAILDHHSSCLSAFADVAAAFSSEALKADLSPFNLMDSADGHASKDEVAVAADMRVLLNGSKLVGKDKVNSVAKIPKVHGTMREQSKALHSKMRVELNSGVKLGECEEAVCVVLLPLAAALRGLGDASFARAQSNLEAIANNDLKLGVREMFGEECPTDVSLSSGFSAALNFFLGKDYDKFAHEVFVLLGLVWKIVAWEAVTAFVVLEAGELSEKINGGRENGESLKEEKKKKKVVLGKGTSSILALIRERLMRERQIALGTWVADFLSFLDLTKPEFSEFLFKVKDIVESNESRRLPKIPKVIVSGFDYSYDQLCVF